MHKTHARINEPLTFNYEILQKKFSHMISTESLKFVAAELNLNLEFVQLFIRP